MGSQNKPVLQDHCPNPQQTGNHQRLPPLCWDKVDIGSGCPRRSPHHGGWDRCATGTFGASSWLPPFVPNPGWGRAAAFIGRGGGASFRDSGCHLVGGQASRRGWGVMAGGRFCGNWAPGAISGFLPDFTYKAQYMKDKNIKNVGTPATEQRPSEHGTLYMDPLAPHEKGLGLGVVNPAAHIWRCSEGLLWGAPLVGEVPWGASPSVLAIAQPDGKGSTSPSSCPQGQSQAMPRWRHLPLSPGTPYTQDFF